MDLVDLIEKKKQGNNHTKEEINFIISSLLSGEFSDSQLASWLMAINFKSLSDDEILYLSEAVAASGKFIDFSEMRSKVFYINSTGGVSEKVSLALIPLLSSSGISAIVLSDRLGYQRIINEFESVPSCNAKLNNLAIVNQVKNVGCAISSFDEGFMNAASKISCVESDTATGSADVLIASSAISKCLVSGTVNMVINLGFGNGALIKSPDEAIHLSSIIINLAKVLNRDITLVLSSAEEPIGRSVGNSIEVIETIEFLKGNLDNSDFADLVYYIGAVALYKAGICSSIDDGVEHLKLTISSGKAIDKFKELITSQGGNAEVTEDYDKFVLPCYKVECESKKSGYVQNIDASYIYLAAKELGVIRNCSSLKVDYAVGIYLNKKSGEYVEKGDVLYTIYSNDDDKTKSAQALCDSAFTIGDTKPSEKSLVYKIIGIEDEDV